MASTEVCESSVAVVTNERSETTNPTTVHHDEEMAGVSPAAAYLLQSDPKRKLLALVAERMSVSNGTDANGNAGFEEPPSNLALRSECFPSELLPGTRACTDAEARKKASDLAAFLRQFHGLTHGRLKSFFLENHWDNVPASWRDPLESLPHDQLSELLLHPHLSRAKEVWPLSLLAFFAAAHALRLPGQPCPPRASGSHAKGSSSVKAGRGVAAAANGRCAEELRLGADLRRALNPKKMHEVVRMSDAVDLLAKHAQCDAVIDLGSGLGYLSRALAFEYNWQVRAVEAEEGNVAAAAKLDATAAAAMRKRLRDKRSCAWQPGVGALSHVKATLSPDIDADGLWRLLDHSSQTANLDALSNQIDELRMQSDEATAAAPPHAVATPGGSFEAAAGGNTRDTSLFGTSEEAGAMIGERQNASSAAAQGVVNKSTHALIGLHTCGDLGPTTLRIFQSAGAAVSVVVSVGCCYMRLTERGSDPTLPQNGRSLPCSPPQVSLTATNQIEVEGTRPAESGVTDQAGLKAQVLENVQTAQNLGGSGVNGADGANGAIGGKEGIDGAFSMRGGGAEFCSECAEAPGYPMSKHVDSLQLQMGYLHRELACHSLTAYAQRLADAHAEGAAGQVKLEAHGRRAVLEYVMRRGLCRDSDAVIRAFEQSAVKRIPGRKWGSAIKGADALPFDEYVSSSLEHLSLPPLSESEKAELMDKCRGMLGQWRRVVVLFTLRLMLAPLWEALIVIDRYLFLREHGHAAAMVPLFDQLLSPRTFAVIGLKKAQPQSV